MKASPDLIGLGVRDALEVPDVLQPGAVLYEDEVGLAVPQVGGH